MTRNINPVMLGEACRALHTRDTEGCWPDNGRSLVFLDIRQMYYPELGDTDDWFTIIEDVVKRNAVRQVGGLF